MINKTWLKIKSWFDNKNCLNHSNLDQASKSTKLYRTFPMIFMHVACLGVLWTGFSAIAIITAIAFYLFRMFAITAFYHRYFSHRAFRTSRFCQFIFALMGNSCVQRGPLWWAAHHRKHHRVSDQSVDDLHSPVTHSFWRSHIGWFLSERGYLTDIKQIPDLIKYPELRWLDRFDTLLPALSAIALFAIGHLIYVINPALGVTGWQMLVWGFFISTVVLYHATFTINSLAHKFGKRRYATKDHSRNNWLLALITLGEGWHNNHHHTPGAAKQGHRWWEIDITYMVLKLMAWCGIIWDLKPVPAHAANTKTSNK